MKKIVLRKLIQFIEKELDRNKEKLRTLETFNEVRNRKKTIIELEYYLDVALESIHTNDEEYIKFLDSEKLNRAKLSHGNRKTGVSSWNTLEGITCTFATNECLKNCYAKKTTMQYKATMFLRIHNTLIALRSDLDILLTKAIQKDDIRTLRIHDAGGFINNDYLMKICTVIEKNKDVEFITYTKKWEYSDLLNKYYDNCTSSFSVYNDTNKDDIKLVEKMKLKTFECLDFEQFRKSTKTKCPIYRNVKTKKNISKQKNKITCTQCGLCMNKDVKNIVVLKH